MSDLIERSVQLINGYVSQWTKKYQHQTFYQEETTQGHIFMTEFSLPTPSKPIPTATVKVYFYIPDLTDPQEKTMSFRFENDSLIHLVSRTIRLSQLEKWIETILARKDRTCRIMFLGTQFEQTRIVNKRMDEVLHERRVAPEKEDLHVDPTLLEFDDELISQYSPPQNETEREMRLLKELLYQIFRQIDQDDLGYISHEECAELFKLMGLHLGRHQLEDSLNRLDVTKTGIISYKELSTFGVEILHAIYCENQAVKDMKDKEEESRFEAQCMLSSELRDLYKKVVLECKKIDEEELHTISPESLKLILEDQSSLLSQDEIKYIMEVIGNEQVEYMNLDQVFNETLFENLVKGLLFAKRSKLEEFLIKQFISMDKENNKYLKVNEVIVALKTCELVKLSRAQLYALQAFIERDAKNRVDYMKEARRLAAIIKKIFNSDIIESKKLLMSDTIVDYYTPVQQLEDVKNTLQNIGS